MYISTTACVPLKACGCYWNNCHCGHYLQVGSCPHCGAPIYQDHQKWYLSVYHQSPTVRYSCSCRYNCCPQPKPAAQALELKIEVSYKKTLAKKRQQW